MNSNIYRNMNNSMSNNLDIGMNNSKESSDSSNMNGIIERTMDRVTLAHGSGGRESYKLIKDVFYKHFKNEILLEQNDSSILNSIEGPIAITTDSFVVDPIIFPGGDIGKLSICGTVNDLAVSGAVPVYITAAFIIEEGFEIEKLESIVESMAKTANESGVKIVAGDTKVVEKDRAQGIYINTTGIGYFPKNRQILSKKNIKVGDKIILSGQIGDHGMCIMAQREFLGVLGDMTSDCQPLNNIIDEALNCSRNIRIMRDPTRGGVSTTLNELIEDTRKSIVIYEGNIPVKQAVRSYCDILGMEPLEVANEGKFICIVSPEDADSVLKVINENPMGQDAAIIGEVVDDSKEKVYLKTYLGATRVVRVVEGELLPRIC